jgi:4-amino-4-deoxy-L-arabinose transferase-like glycosyltransferase
MIPPPRSAAIVEPVPGRWWVVAAALLAARLGALLWVVARQPGPITGDEPLYEELAGNLLGGRGYVAHGAPWVWKPPGWPIVLAGLHAVFGPGRLGVVFAQGLFDSGTAVLCGWCAWRIMNSRVAGAIAFLLALTWPPFFREARFMQTEPLFTLCVMATVAAFTRFALVPSAGRAFVLGMAAGVAALVRPNGLVPVAGLVLGWLVHRFRHVRVDVPRLAALALGTALVLAPWTIRNARVFHAFIPVSTGTGEFIYMGSTPETDGRWNHVRWMELRTRVVRAEEARVGHRLDVKETDSALLRAGLANWRADFGGSAWIAVKRFWRLCFLPVVSEDRPWLRGGFFVALLALYALAIPAGIAGLRSGNGPRALAGAVFVAVVVNAIALSVFYTNSRYFEPTRPLVFILAAGTLAGVPWFRRNPR